MTANDPNFTYPNPYWGPFEDDPMSPLLDMGSGPAFDAAVQTILDRIARQEAAEKAAHARSRVQPAWNGRP
jgi:hypothetical protein